MHGQQPHMFSTPGGGPPQGFVGDDSKITSDFRGGLEFVGGSQPEEGHYIEDPYPQKNSVSPGDSLRGPGFGGQ